MKTSQKENILKHGENLLEIFPNATEQDPLKLCRKLRRIENSTNRSAEDYCNGLISCDQWEHIENNAKTRLQKLLGHAKGLDYMPVEINDNPRGYALQICEKYIRETKQDIFRDMCGYGILAPEIR